MNSGINIFFIETASPFEEIEKYKHFFVQNAEVILKKIHPWFPVGDETNPQVVNDLNDCWLENISTVKFMFWPRYNLLGVVAAAAPNGWQEIYFQDSVKAYESWPQIPVFQKVVSKMEVISASDLKRMPYIMEIIDDEENDYDFLRKTAAYHEIVKILSIDKIIKNSEMSDPAHNYYVEKISMISSSEDKHKLKLITKGGTPFNE